MQYEKKQRRVLSGWFTVVVVLATFAPPLLLNGGSSSADITFLDPQGTIAAAQRRHLFEVVLLVMIVVLAILVLTPFFAWRYRYRNEASPCTPDWSFSWPLDAGKSALSHTCDLPDDNQGAEAQ
jgi:cytochrome o ubiquinol oxidase subunit 2